MCDFPTRFQKHIPLETIAKTKEKRETTNREHEQSAQVVNY